MAFATMLPPREQRWPSRNHAARQTPSVATTAGMAADRFASRLALVQLRLDGGRLGDARSCLDRLLAEPLDESQRRAARELGLGLAARLREARERLVAQLRRGEVLAARGAVDRLLAARVPRGDEDGHALTEALPEVGVAGDWRRAIEVGDRPLPVAAPLQRNRQVRVHWRDEPHVGTVASSRSGRVTVRILTESGQTYPTLLRAACEPIDVGAAEAVEMALACVHARANRYWPGCGFACAHLLADGRLDVRGQRVRDVLR